MEPSPARSQRDSFTGAEVSAGSAAGFGELQKLGRQNRGPHLLGVQLMADVLGVDLERLADALERERPRRVRRADPLASLASRPAPRALAQHVEGVLED